MFDSHLNSHGRLSYYGHGPEWAFVIPDGDTDALLDVVRVCSRVWNGVNNIIVVAGANGRLRGHWRADIASRAIDQTWLHPSLSEQARAAAVQAKLPGLVSWGTGFGFDGLHPSHLVADPNAPRWPMTMPRHQDEPLRHMAAVTWGIVEDSGDWTGVCDFGVADGDFGFSADVSGQVGFNSTSPLDLSAVATHPFGARGAQDWPYLWVFERGDFRELVAFWNLRARSDAKNAYASVIGVPRQALRCPEQLQGLLVWAQSATGVPRTPSILVKASKSRLPEVERALAAIGIERDPESAPAKHHKQPPERKAPTWLPQASPTAPSWLLRGVWNGVDYTTHDGVMHVTLPRPRGFLWRGGMPLVIQTLPTPLPITETAADRIHRGAFAHPRGLGMNHGSPSPWALTLRLPNEHTALADWAADHDYATQEPRVAYDARALLGRLGNLDALDALADACAVEVLAALAPLSRDQLVKKLAGTFSRQGREEALADQLAEALRAEGLLLEVDARTVEQLNSRLSGRGKRELIAVLDKLVAGGFVQRGRNVKCPRCRYRAFLPLRELDEHVRCRACNASSLLAVTASSGDEAPTAYRVDGLMARVMDQHVLPVMLAIRALRDPSRYPRPAHVWPGVLFQRDGERPFDVDLLASDGETVFAVECKLDARGLGMSQLRKLTTFTDRVGAVPVVAALAGDFSDNVRRWVERREGVVLDRASLLKIGSAPGDSET